MAAGVSAAGTASPIKNVIVMIADGAGANTLEATRLYLNGLAANDPRRGSGGANGLVTDGPGFQATAQSVYPLSTRNAPIAGLAGLAQDPNAVYDPAKNYDFDPVAGTNSAGYLRAFDGYEWNRATAPDSANTASTLTNGEKSYNNAVNVDGSGLTETTLAEVAKSLGKATGVVSTVQLSDATPAATGGAHNVARANANQIAQEMFEHGVLDVIAGTGNPDFNDDGRRVATPNNQWIGADLWAALKNDTFRSDDGQSWTLLQDRASIQAAATGTPTSERLAIVPQAFTGTNYYRSGAAPAGATEIPFSVPRLESSPTLSELSLAALNRLNVDPDGFYVSIEGGAVDRAMHGNNFGRMIEEYVDFNDAVKSVMDWVNSPDSRATMEDTLVIVTADHDHLLFGPEGATIPFQPVQPDRDRDGVPEYRWFSNNHSNQIVPLLTTGANAGQLVSLADDQDVVRNAQGQVVAGSGQAFTDQAEVGQYLLDQVRLSAVQVNDQNNGITGSAANEVLRGLGGDDTLDGAAGNDVLFGDAGNDRVDGGLGNDQVRGYLGNDTLFGSAGNDQLFGEEGDDFLGAGSGSDYLSGGIGNDALYGEEGSDLLFGNAGDDLLMGGAGGDTFAVGRGDGRDVIRDFTVAGAERDVIAFNSGVFGSFAAVQAASAQQGGDVVITVAPDSSLTVQNVALASLTAANFSFS
ncbi:alkaline phosphatase [Methylobacterium oryzisoli]|uniref:alkaline phosphatase n=1 Tax=Methylobacterium oryzisoli TaxID=3385502 RepID=UPI003891B8E1